MKTITLNRVGPALKSDPSRVLIRPFQPGDETSARRLAARVLALPEATVTQLLGEVLGEFGDRHARLEEFLHRRFDEVSRFLSPEAVPSPDRQLLLASYFTHEYSLEAAALFNPSIVPHPDQTDLPAGALAYIFCQVPVVVLSGQEEKIEVRFTDGRVREVTGHALDAEVSRHVFGRDGHIQQLTVHTRAAL